MLPFLSILNGALILMLTFTRSYAQTDPQPGSILTPRPGTKILPGAQFNFSYFGRADYGVSSYNYHVWLLGDQVSSDGFMGGLGGSSGGKDSYIHGWYFGRFDYQNWPAVPYPKNPAPTQLTMPDFSKDQGGWGAGKAGSNVKFNLVVYEEYDDEFGTFGRKIGFASSEIIYNATGTP